MNNVPVAEMRRFGPNECADDDQRHRLYPSYLKEVDNCEDGRWVVPDVPTAESQYISRMWVLGLALVRKRPKGLHSIPGRPST